jgi:hypothetical protein
MSTSLASVIIPVWSTRVWAELVFRQKLFMGGTPHCSFWTNLFVGISIIGVWQIALYMTECNIVHIPIQFNRATLPRFLVFD